MMKNRISPHLLLIFDQANDKRKKCHTKFHSKFLCDLMKSLQMPSYSSGEQFESISQTKSILCLLILHHDRASRLGVRFFNEFSKIVGGL